MKLSIFLCGLIFPTYLMSQQIADTTYQPKIYDPAYERGTGPVIFIDEGHHNFHTKEGRYKAFAMLLERDGYTVTAYKGEFEEEELKKGKLLVISNALNELNTKKWHKPILSAFTPQEIEKVKKWVYEGGALFLIADHMPMAGAAKELAAAFEFEFTDGFVVKDKNKSPDYFRLTDGTLKNNSITNGRNSSERVKQVVSFTGQAFRAPEDANSILTFSNEYFNLLPDTAWVFNAETIRFNAEGWSQGAYKKYGKGRIVVFGEAAMFTAQLSGPNKRKMGMSKKIAKENYQLLLNIIHWLDGMID